MFLKEKKKKEKNQFKLELLLH